jgi:ferrochelatase
VERFVKSHTGVRQPEPQQVVTDGYNSQEFATPPMAASESRFGFVAFAETWNGRLAMLGFVIGLATELLTGQGILSQIGLG